MQLCNSIRAKFVEDVIKAAERIAPLKLADSSWDNVGLIAECVGAMKERSVLVTNDLTVEVVAEAVDQNASMIIAYHPPWFKGAKSLRADGPLRSITLCLSHGISVYSPHTALDSIKGGSTRHIIVHRQCNGLDALIHKRSASAAS